MEVQEAAVAEEVEGMEEDMIIEIQVRLMDRGVLSILGVLGQGTGGTGRAVGVPASQMESCQPTGLLWKRLMRFA